MRPETPRGPFAPTTDAIASTESTDYVEAIGYIRVSTDEQADSGAGLEAQRRTITQAAELRSWNLIEIYEDGGASGKNLNRPGLLAALAAVDNGVAQVLLVAKLDRLSRSLIDFAGLMERARKKGWDLAALDLGVDTSSPQGEMVANVMATFAQFERRLIGLRTKEALAVKRSQGVRLGRPPVVNAEVVDRIIELRRKGLSYCEVARQLDAAGVPTPRGGNVWHDNTVRRLYLGNVRRGPPRVPWMADDSRFRRRSETLDKGAGVHVEGCGEADDVLQRDVPFASLDRAEVGEVHPGLIGEGHLADAEAVSMGADPVTELACRVESSGGPAHPGPPHQQLTLWD